MSTVRTTSDTPFDNDTIEGRLIREQAAASRLALELHEALNMLRSVDRALDAECVDSGLTRAGRIRLMGDRVRVAERRFETLEAEWHRTQTS